MNPDTPITQIPDEALATHGWNLREQQDAYRRQADMIERELAAVRAEFTRRSQIRVDAAKAAEKDKKTEQDALVARIADTVLKQTEKAKQQVPAGEPKAA